MKIISLTSDQQNQIATLKAKVDAAKDSIKNANEALQKYLTSITGKPVNRVFGQTSVSEDGKFLISK